jgi:hypothetical protein
LTTRSASGRQRSSSGSRQPPRLQADGPSHDLGMDRPR